MKVDKRHYRYIHPGHEYVCDRECGQILRLSCGPWWRQHSAQDLLHNDKDYLINFYSFRIIWNWISLNISYTRLLILWSKICTSFHPIHNQILSETQMRTKVQSFAFSMVLHNVILGWLGFFLLEFLVDPSSVGLHSLVLYLEFAWQHDI